MPYPNEHAARVVVPGKFEEGSFRRKKLPGSNVVAIIGKLKGESTTTVQAYRFPIKYYTAEQAKAWLKENKVKNVSFEAASKKDEETDELEDADNYVNDELEEFETTNRIDYMPFEGDGPDGVFMSEPMKLTEEGYLVGRAPATNVGVFPYLLADGTVQYELRPPEEVFHPDSINSLKNKPVTNNHPSVKVTSENIKELGVGFTGDAIHADQYYLSPTITITDKQAVEEVQNGKRALSCGYSVDLVMKSGNWLGIHYDAIQTNIRYNHLAIVPKGRAGDGAVMKLDSMESVGIRKIDRKENNERRVKMAELTVDNVKYDVSPDVLALYQKKETELATVKADSKEALEKAQTTLATATAKADEFEEKYNKAKEDLENLQKENVQEKIDAAVNAKLELHTAAGKAGVEIKKDMTDDDIKKAIILSVYPNAKEKLDAKADDPAYLNARYDSALEDVEENAAKHAIKGDALSDETTKETKKDEAPAGRTVEQARKDMIDRMVKASQGKED